jgi:hypothetical protein
MLKDDHISKWEKEDRYHGIALFAYLTVQMQNLKEYKEATHWLAVVCDMGSEKCDWVIFDDWEHEKVRFVAQEVSYHLRQTALQCELLTRKKLMEEMMIPDWRLEEAIDFYTKEGSH